MMTHAASETSPYSAAVDYYAGDFVASQAPVDPAAFYRPQQQLSEEASALADALAGIEIAQSGRNKPGLPHNKELVVHAIESAASVLQDQASALRDQISENDRLRSALRVIDWELQNFRIDQRQGLRSNDNPSQDDAQPYTNVQQLGPLSSERSSMLQGLNQPFLNRESWIGNDLVGDPQSSLIVHPNVQFLTENPYLHPSNGVQVQQYSSNFGTNGVLGRNIPDVLFSHTLSPTSRFMSPIRLGREGEAAVRLQLGGVGSVRSRQDLVKNAPRPQDEEMQLVHENKKLKEQISELRLTIKKYQQELLVATSRETSVRQDELEKNARLTSELRAADEDLHFYASHLMPLLADCGMQPATRDPHSIVSGIKTLVQHLRDQHLREEGRGDSTPPRQQWQASPGYPASQHGLSSSPVHLSNWIPKTPDRRCLEIVPQASYLHPERPLSPSSPSPLAHNPGDWNMQGAPNQRHPFNNDNYANENVRRSPYSAQTADPQHPSSHGISMDDNSLGMQQGNDPYAYGDGESSATDEDLLPGIDGLCINGDAILGCEVIARGLSINGTTLCHFQWVRHHRDGSFFHIPGAAQPEYTITADDVDTLLSLECTPMDDRNRKGAMVQIFANNHITLESEIKDQIFAYLDSGQANFDVTLVVESPEDASFEPAMLSLKRSVYELKKVNGRRNVASERYASESAVEIKVGKDSQCAIINNLGAMHLLDCFDNRMRDLLVLTMREFIKAAVERRRGKRRSWLK